MNKRSIVYFSLFIGIMFMFSGRLHSAWWDNLVQAAKKVVPKPAKAAPAVTPAEEPKVTTEPVPVQEPVTAVPWWKKIAAQAAKVVKEVVPAVKKITKPKAAAEPVAVTEVEQEAVVEQEAAPAVPAWKKALEKAKGVITTKVIPKVTAVVTKKPAEISEDVTEEEPEVEQEPEVEPDQPAWKTLVEGAVGVTEGAIIPKIKAAIGKKPKVPKAKPVARKKASKKASKKGMVHGVAAIEKSVAGLSAKVAGLSAKVDKSIAKSEQQSKDIKILLQKLVSKMEPKPAAEEPVVVKATEEPAVVDKPTTVEPVVVEPVVVKPVEEPVAVKATEEAVADKPTTITVEPVAAVEPVAVKVAVEPVAVKATTITVEPVEQAPVSPIPVAATGE